MYRRILCLSVFSLSVFAAPAVAQAPKELDPEHAAKMAQGLDLFKKGVKEILITKCLRCHGGKHIESDFDLGDRDTLLKGGKRGAAIVPGRSAESTLVTLITHARAACRRDWRSSRTLPSPPSASGSTSAPYDGRSPTNAPRRRLDRQGPASQGEGVLVVRTAAQSRAPEGQERALDQDTSRSLHRRKDGGGGRLAESAGRPPRPHPPRLLHAHRPAAQPRGSRGVRERQGGRRLSQADRPSPRQPALRRALGPPLARPGPLRREPWLRARLRPADRLPLPRLRHRGIQQGCVPFNKFAQWQIAGDELDPDNPLLESDRLPGGRVGTPDPPRTSRETATTNWTANSPRSAPSWPDRRLRAATIGDPIPQRVITACCQFTATVRLSRSHRRQRCLRQEKAEFDKAHQPLVEALKAYEPGNCPASSRSGKRRRSALRLGDPRPSNDEVEDGAPHRRPTVHPGDRTNGKFDVYTFDAPRGRRHPLHPPRSASHPTMVKGGPGRAPTAASR